MPEMAAITWTTLHLPCLMRPKSQQADCMRAGKEKQAVAPNLAARHTKGNSAARPKVSLDKVKCLSSNAVAAAARYHHRDLTEDYKVSPNKVLGEGCGGKVMLATSLVNGRQCALKRISKNSVAPAAIQQLIAEVEICLTLDHPNVVRLDDVYDTDHEIALLTECLEGGELYDRLAKAKTFSETLASETTRQMLRAVAYLHSHNIVHRDLKLENILYESRSEDSPIKLIDFGFAKVWDSSRPMQASCGSVAYVSPDVLRGHGYTSQCDLWSLGVIVFMLLVGYPPFHGSDDAIRAKIVVADVDWHHPQRWNKVSVEAKDFVNALLVRDPAGRLDAQTALKHQWLTSVTPMRKPVLSAAALRSLGSYAGAPSFWRAVLQLIARELAPNEVTDLRRMFLDMAGDEEGTVRLSELKAAIRGDESALLANSDSGAKTPVRRLRRAKTEKLAELFQVMDVNGDEQVYYSDFLAATMNEELRFREEHIRAAFRRLDADNSGTISAEDIQNTVGQTFEGLEALMLMKDAGLSSLAQGDISFDAFVGVLEHCNGCDRSIESDCIVAGV